VKLIVAGSLMMSACAPIATKPAAEQLAAGERAYQKCYSCHALDPGRNDLTGPTLHRIVGRRVAAEAGYDYSPALRRLAQTEPRWNKPLLDRFIEDPETVVPGTSMTFHGISDRMERAALVAFLEHRHTKASAANLP
jgi:cytochrome c